MTISSEPLLQVENLVKHFSAADTGSFFQKQKNVVHAVDGISFNLYKGETLGLVGGIGLWKINRRSDNFAAISPDIRLGPIRWSGSGPSSTD